MARYTAYRNKKALALPRLGAPGGAHHRLLLSVHFQSGKRPSVYAQQPCVMLHSSAYQLILCDDVSFSTQLISGKSSGFIAELHAIAKAKTKHLRLPSSSWEKQKTKSVPWPEEAKQAVATYAGPPDFDRLLAPQLINPQVSKDRAHVHRGWVFNTIQYKKDTHITPSWPGHYQIGDMAGRRIQ